MIEIKNTTKRFLAGLVLFFLTSIAISPRTNAAGFDKNYLAQRQAGADLVSRMRDLRPARNNTSTGLMKIRHPGGNLIEVPVLIRTIVTLTNWQSIYATTTSLPLVVVQSHEGPNEYKRLRTAGVGPVPNLAGATVLSTPFYPFAGSEFWLFDLGLGFVQWPDQRVTGTSIRKGQRCHVLESSTPHPASGGYSRVVSWVDLDTLGIVHAEAYDARSRLLKVFDPKRFKKVNGKWQLKEMEIRNEITDSRSTLIFDLTVE